MNFIQRLLAIFAVMLLCCVAVAQKDAPTSHPLKVDRNHSTIGFEVPIMNGLSKVTGKFTDFDVSIVRDDADITRSTINATIRVSSIDTGIKERDEDLRGAGFFDAAKYPTITFVSQRIDKVGERMVAHGTLTMKGVAKEVDLPFGTTGTFDLMDGKRRLVGFHSEMKLNRRDYGITWEHNAIAAFVGDNVGIVIDLIAS